MIIVRRAQYRSMREKGIINPSAYPDIDNAFSAIDHGVNEVVLVNAARFSDLVLADGTHPVITTEWQDLVIDLEASGFPGMTNAFHLRAFAKCVIWLDEITFSEAVAPVDATSQQTILDGMTVPETGKPGDLPIKDFLAELE